MGFHTKYLSAKKILQKKNTEESSRERRMAEIYGDRISHSQLRTVKQLAKLLRKSNDLSSVFALPVLYYLVADLEKDLFGILEGIQRSKKKVSGVKKSGTKIFFSLDYPLSQQKEYKRMEKKMNEEYFDMSVNITPNAFVRGRSFHGGQVKGLYFPDITNAFYANDFDDSIIHSKELSALLTRPGNDIETVLLLDPSHTISPQEKINYLRKKFGKALDLQKFPFFRQGLHSSYSVSDFSDLPEGDSDLARLGAKIL